MKRVDTISINGIVFSIEDDAYGKLNSYIDVLAKYFEKEHGGQDIIADIEARISELFLERQGGASRVATIEDVSKVIETLGTPEDIAGSDSNKETEFVPPPRQRQRIISKPQPRLYRDPDNRYLGGVCAGIGLWMGINPAAIRLLFIFFTIILLFPFFPFSKIFPFFQISFLKIMPFLTYCLFWGIIPKARTTAQKLEMRGEPVNISNIEKNIKESLSDPSLKKSFRDFLEEAGEFLGTIFGMLGRIIGIMIGLLLFFIGVVLAIVMTGLFFMQDIVFSNTVQWDFLSFTELFRNIISPASFAILFVYAVIIVMLVVLALMFWGAKLMSGLKVKHKLLHVALAVLWITAIVTFIIACLSQVRNFAWQNEPIVETQQIDIARQDTIYLSLASPKRHISNNPMEIYFDKDNRCFYGKPNLRILKSDDNKIRLTLNRKSQGESKRAAYQYAENIEYSVDVYESSIIFDSYFTVNPKDKWKFQTLNITLYVPEGAVIIADNALSYIRLSYY